MSTQTIAESLILDFGHMARRDGGALTVLGATDADIRIGYRPGQVPTCDDGSCVLEHVELEAMLSEALRRRAPEVNLTIEVVE
jgi:hypothetical protein